MFVALIPFRIGNDVISDDMFAKDKNKKKNPTTVRDKEVSRLFSFRQFA
jgi:hypothetical protein